jgi:thymidylate synthase ThyX
LGKLVTPNVFMVGYTNCDYSGLRAYLEYTGQEDFMRSVQAAKEEGLSDGEILCSFYAKLCYKSLVLGKNSNVKRVRDIPDNVRSILDTAHGSVLEHAAVNFIVTDCSRVFTHEQVRHRQGVAYSQTSGRYCRLDSIEFVWDDLLEPVRGLAVDAIASAEKTVYLMECRLGLRKPPYGASPDDIPAAVSPAFRAPVEIAGMLWPLRGGMSPDEVVFLTRVYRADSGGYWQGSEADAAALRAMCRWVPDDKFNFEKRKQLTSLIRRFAPNGQANEIGVSLNLRALRHIVQVRTARHSEREIRNVYGQVYNLVKARFPLIFCDAREKMYDGMLEISGMKTQPYEIAAGDPRALEYFDVSALESEIARRRAT